MPNAITASEGYFLDQLAKSQVFLTVLRGQIIKVALVIKAEPLNTPDHALRSGFANSVLTNVDDYTRRIAPLIVTTANLLNKTTILDGMASSTATESEIFSQLSSSWTMLAGKDTGT